MWFKPVAFVHEKHGLTRIKSSLEAMQVLSSWWTKVDGDAYKNAIDVCIECLHGTPLHEDARAAFILALIEGQIDIDPVAEVSPDPEH